MIVDLQQHVALLHAVVATLRAFFDEYPAAQNDAEI